MGSGLSFDCSLVYESLLLLQGNGAPLNVQKSQHSFKLRRRRLNLSEPGSQFKQAVSDKTRSLRATFKGGRSSQASDSVPHNNHQNPWSAN